LRPSTAPVYRRIVAGLSCARRAAAVACLLAAAAGAASCTTIDPGPNFVIPDVTFNADYFYCHVEPELIFAKNCGPGDPSLGDSANGCHYNPSAVSGMALIQHPAVDCGGGDHPVDSSQTGTGGPAQGNLEAVSLEMNQDWQTAPLFVRPSGNNHPRQIFTQSDMQVRNLLMTWATK
jgi:hypothetical protein